MGYRFIGLLIHDSDLRNNSFVTEKGFARSISSPYNGPIVSFINQNWMANQDVAKAVSQTYKDVKVLYLEYDTWAGNLDYCHGQILRNGQVLHESEGEEESDFIDLFKKFGVDSEFDGFFPPFERGFFPNT